MKTSNVSSLFLFFIVIAIGATDNAHAFFQQGRFKEYKGAVVDSDTGDELVFASLTLGDTNISTITNNEGEFTLKVPDEITSGDVTVAFLGYQTKKVPLTDFRENNTRITLDISVIELSAVNVAIPKDAKALVREVLRKRKDNNLDEATLMTAFYRETIKKRKRNVSLTEAVVDVYKQPYSSLRRDIVSMHKSRKNTDYKRLDTIAVKLQGGPFTTLFVDMMKYPEYIFHQESIDDYQFSFDRYTTVNDKPIYVVKFKQRDEIYSPRYYGTLYIDANTKALTSAVYSLNVENRLEASRWFVRKKPKGTDVYPTEATYRVDYRQKNGKWYYGYSNVQLSLKVVKKGKWFNSIYTLSSEMAITDWKKNPNGIVARPKDRLKPTIVISDEASGFSDPDFWGEYNVIEPEKSIESAIKKIQRQLKRLERSGS